MKAYDGNGKVIRHKNKGFLCDAEDCINPAHTKGLCRNHYMMKWHYGRTKTIIDGEKRSHSLYGIWWDRKNYGSLGEEFLDFNKFKDAVKERPSKDYYLVRIDESKPYAPDNFEWKFHLKRAEGESKKDWYARKWADRKARIPDMDRRRDLKRKFGITKEDYSAMHAKQNGLCAICKNPETAYSYKGGSIRDLAVDHCHKTNKVRDLLCFSCNSVIGRVKESIELLEAMKQYLIKHSQPT